jgi:hypothetical protein
MHRPDAVVDASFWINAERSQLVDYLPEYFALWVPPLVVEELTTAARFADWLKRGEARLLSPEGRFERFDAGENEAIALALERDWVLLMDDQAPRHFSRGPLRLRVVDSPAFAVFLYDQGRLSRAEAVAALRESQAGRRMVSEAQVTLELIARRKGER